MQHQTTYSSQIIPQFPEQEHLNCPRCDSSNTKFCYYNNYNLSQPRHFCKSCKRYWTKGGTLRNIPVGGVIRKNNTKRSSNRKRSSSPASSSAISTQDPPKPEQLALGFSSPNGQLMSLLVGLNTNGAMQLGESTTDNPNSSSESNMIGREFGSSEKFSGGDSSYCYWNGASGWPDLSISRPGSVDKVNNI